MNLPVTYAGSYYRGACLRISMKKESIVTKKVTGKPSKIMGPVDFLVVRFPGNKFSGLIAPELKKLEKRVLSR